MNKSPELLIVQRRRAEVYGALSLLSIVLLGSIQIPIMPSADGSGTSVPLAILAAIGILIVRARETAWARVLIVAFLLTFWHALQLLWGVPGTDPVRTVGGIVLISIVIPSLIECFDAVKDERLGGRVFFAGTRILLTLQLAFQLLQIIVPALAVRTSEHYFLPIIRPPGFFAEPSHLAIGLSPFVGLLIVMPQYARRVLRRSGITAVIFSLILCPSTLAIAIVLAAAAIRLVARGRLGWRGAVTTLAAIAVAVWVGMETDAVRERIGDLSGGFAAGTDSHETNLSSLVFLQGAYMSVEGVSRYPLGVGILNFQSLTNVVEVWVDLNIKDASSLFFKGLGEFGVLFLFFEAAGIFLLIRAVRSRSMDIHTRALYFMFSFSFLVAGMRGASYYDWAPAIGFALAYIQLEGAFRCTIRTLKPINGKHLFIPQINEDSS